MVNMKEDFVVKHHEYYGAERPVQNKGRISVPGAQYVVHLLRGGYLGEEWKDGRGRRALDVGCGSGFNSVSLSMLGWQVSGTEISAEIVEHARKTAAPYGHAIDFRVGENENLPFEDRTFDLLISINVIHYCASAEGIAHSVDEYARVLKPGGLLLLFTNHPDNWTVKDSEPLGEDMVLVRCDGDYRDKQPLFLFRDLDHLETMYAPKFTHIQTGINRTEFFSRTLIHQVMVAVRKED